MKGFATAEGTKNYRDQFIVGAVRERPLHPSHFREKQGLWFSSVGIGSYLGEGDEETDRLYEEALKVAVLSGVNVIDSAINYRFQRSERSFGKALKELIASREVKREELILCTKGGFIPFDGEYPANPSAYFQKTFIETGILKPEEVVQECHAMTPRYLENQLQRSLANLGVETFDIYYLHNPETQLAEVERKEFLNRMRLAFEWLEKKVQEGKIKLYGTATWNGYRVEENAEDYLSIEELQVLAREVGGAGHHFKAVQLPFNLAMPEAWILANQRYGANAVPFLGLVDKFDLIVIGSGSLLQGRLTGQLPSYLDPHFPDLPKSSQRALQFARSAPGITTSLVGMKSKNHVRENLEVAKVPVMGQEKLSALFQKN